MHRGITRVHRGITTIHSGAARRRRRRIINRIHAAFEKGLGDSLCQELGIVVNLEKSTLAPSQQITYLGIRSNSQTFRASATPLRIEKFSIAEEFLSSNVQSAKFWRVLLGHLASLSRLVSNGQLRMRALQLALSRGWDFRDEEVLVPWDLPSRDDLRWWCTEGRSTRESL